MRALSLRAGLHEKAVTTLLNRPDIDMRQANLAKLAQAIGADPAVAEARRQITYAELINRLHAEVQGEVARRKALTAESRLRWLLRNAGRTAQTEIVDRRKVIEFFENNRPSTFGLSPGSYATYKSDILAIIDGAPRPRSALDLEGVYLEVQKAIRDSELPLDLKNNGGSFLIYLQERGIQPHEISQATLLDYHACRVEFGVKGEAKTRKHVKTVARLLDRLALEPDLAGFGFAAPGHPYGDGRNKYEVHDSRIAALLQDFDERVPAWSRGEVSATGLSRVEFIANLDAGAKAEPDGKKALLRRKERQVEREEERARWNEDLARAGFLLPDDRWTEKTLEVRRGFIAAAAKALLNETGYLIESLEELTDPDVVETFAEALSDANQGRHSSGYVESVLKTVRKLARGLIQRPAEDVQRIGQILDDHAVDRDGLAPRNIAKLEAFTGERQQSFIDLSSTLMEEINAEVDLRKRRLRRQGHRSPTTKQLYDAELARKVMVVVAHDILLSRAPRSANVVGIRLDWIRWRDGRAAIVVPAVQVKGRGGEDADLQIHLSEAASALLRSYIEVIRPLVLRSGDEMNPFLFPTQDHAGGRPGQPFCGLLARLCREVHRVVGTPINPHLYRHLLGWIWLREDPTQLPNVSKILGHKSIDTTARYYAQLDEELAHKHWQDYLDDRSNKKRQPPRGFGGGSRKSGS